MEEGKFDWVTFFSEYFKISLALSALVILLIIISYKLLEKFLDKKLDIQNKKIEKELEFVYVLKEKAIDSCRSILRIVPRLRDGIYSSSIVNFPNDNMLENISNLEDELRSLRILISEKDSDYLVIHIWKTALLKLITKKKDLNNDFFDEEKKKLLTEYELVNKSIENLIKRFTK